MPRLTLPNWLYEGLRWAVSVALPALIVMLNTIGTTWGWMTPEDAGRWSATGAAITLCAGIVFGWAKLSGEPVTDDDVPSVGEYDPKYDIEEGS